MVGGRGSHEGRRELRKVASDFHHRHLRNHCLQKCSYGSVSLLSHNNDCSYRVIYNSYIDINALCWSANGKHSWLICFAFPDLSLPPCDSLCALKHPREKHLMHWEKETSWRCSIDPAPRTPSAIAGLLWPSVVLCPI